MILQFLAYICSAIFSFIYDQIISNNLTLRTYTQFFNTTIPPHSMLDVGVGTGLPLAAVIEQLKGCQVDGIDIDQHYVAVAQDRFAQHSNVNIMEADILQWQNKRKYQMVLFSFSFMIIPDRPACLRRVREMLEWGGQVVFFMTLQKKRSAFKERIKPWLKYLTSIDFGEVVYHNDFIEVLEEGGLELVEDRQMAGSWVFRLVDVHVVRTRFRR